jgi:hypothetical protein
VSYNNYCKRSAPSHQRTTFALRVAVSLYGELNGMIVVSGSSAELIRRQADRSWLYVIDHAAGAVCNVSAKNLEEK